MVLHIKCPICNSRLADKGSSTKKVIVKTTHNHVHDISMKCHKCKQVVYLNIKAV